MATPILNIPTVAASQTQKEVTINDAIAALEAAGNDVVAVEVDSTNALTVTDAQWRGYGMIQLSPAVLEDAPTAPITLTVPAIKRQILLYNATSLTITAAAAGQVAPGVVIDPDAVMAVVNDGTDLRPASGTRIESLLDIDDTPSTYFEQGGKALLVKDDETGLEFGEVSAGGGGGSLTVESEPTIARTLALTDAGAYIRMENAGAGTVTVPDYASVAFTVGTVIHIHQAGAGQVTIAAAAGVTINSPETLMLRTQHSVATLFNTGTDAWDLIGDLEPANPPTVDAATFVPGKPAESGTIMQFVTPRAITIPASAAGSHAYVGTAATATADFDIQKNGLSAGTLSFAIGANTGTFTVASDVSLAAGDRLSIVAPSPQDATLADLSITIAATRG